MTANQTQQNKAQVQFTHSVTSKDLKDFVVVLDKVLSQHAELTKNRDVLAILAESTAKLSDNLDHDIKTLSLEQLNAEMTEIDATKVKAAELTEQNKQWVKVIDELKKKNKRIKALQIEIEQYIATHRESSDLTPQVDVAQSYLHENTAPHISSLADLDKIEDLIKTIAELQAKHLELRNQIDAYQITVPHLSDRRFRSETSWRAALQALKVSLPSSSQSRTDYITELRKTLGI